MSKILAIDYKTTNGHRNFNKIHVDSLIELGHSVHLVGRKEAFSSIEQNEKVTCSFFPNWAYRKFPLPSISERVKSIVCLRWISNHCQLNDYDIILFLSYEILSLVFFRTNKQVILINHNTVAQLDSRLKLYLTRHLPKHYVHVVLSQEMGSQLKNYIGREVVYIPHGFVLPSRQIDKPLFLKEKETFLFCGINNNFDRDFVNSIFLSKKLEDYLFKKGVKLLVKKKLVKESNSKQVVVLDNVLTNNEYNYLLQMSLAVVLPYSRGFQYRCSGILFESIAAKKPVIATRINSMNYFEDKINIKLFDDVDGFISCIDYFINTGIHEVDEQLFLPKDYWKSLLNKMH